METSLGHPVFSAMVQPSTTTSATTCSPIDEDTTSPSYIPRMARMIPTSSTVHTYTIQEDSRSDDIPTGRALDRGKEP